MVLLRLAVRLSLGSGRRDLFRAALMAAGIALAVLTVLVALAIPRALDQARQAEMARQPVTSRDATQGPVVSYTQAVLEGQVWGRMMVSGPDSRLPPGLDAWPEPGHSVVSPALAEHLSRHPDAGAELGIVDPVRISEEGLTSPTEFFSWTVLKQPQAGEHSTGFGNPDVTTLAAPVTDLLWAELAVLVGLPALVFGAGSLRMGYASRANRYDRLILLGIRHSQCARLFAGEMVAISALGYGAGVGCYALIQGALGGSGLLGITWWPSTGQPSPWPAAIGFVALAVATWYGSAWVMRTRLGTAPSRSRRRGGWAPVAGLILLTFGGGYALTVAAAAFLRRAEPRTDDSLIIALVAAIVAGIVGTLLVTHPLVRLFRGLTPPGRAPALRLGLALAEYHVGSVRRQLAAFIVFIALAGFGATLSTALETDALGDPSQVGVSVMSTKLSPDQRVRLVGLDYPQTTLTGNDQRMITIGSCETIAVADPLLFEDPANCRDEILLGTEAPSAEDVESNGVRLSLAQARRDERFTGDVFLPASQAEKVARFAGWDTTFVVSSTDGSLDRLVRGIREISPSVRIDYGVEDSVLFSVYTQQVGLLRAATVGGATLILLSLIAGLIEARWSTEPSVIGQVHMGVTRATLRSSFALSLAGPLALSGVLALAVIMPACLALASVWGWSAMTSTAIWGTPVLVLALASVLSIALGWAVGGPPKVTREIPAD